MNYVNGIKHIKEIIYRDDKTIKTIINYFNGMKHGYSYEYDENEECIKIIEYVNDHDISESNFINFYINNID